MKKRARAKPPKARTPARPALKKAVPPPDAPLLRHEAEEAARAGGADEKRQAQARAKALRQTREMPTADESPAPPASEATDSP
jgi:hypothetical protein